MRSRKTQNRRNRRTGRTVQGLERKVRERDISRWMGRSSCSKRSRRDR